MAFKYQYIVGQIFFRVAHMNQDVVKLERHVNSCDVMSL